ncbi:hypothetical protein NEMBOFW57_008427 [Staphylotrichum longicolle]|uniref:Major facilitator superfamily (MFS) profile domain-containing protein n=1 Tax=Staphylotrichum longicolle TaxID=669026 RepID=A0AAD4ERE9_9PEZI|nr:hypothetical protein NEMBOFW57_008427 [Staphylotrichum longicolle]
MDANEKETHPSSGSTLTPSPPSSTTPSLNIPDHHHHLDPDPEKVSTSSTTDDKAAAVGLFEPIRAAPGTANDNNNVSSARRRLSVDTVSTLRRERSNNGWGVDDIEDSAADADAVVAPYNNQPGSASGRRTRTRSRTNASASYTATYGQMNEEFHTSRLVATLGLSTFVLGIALGPFWSPLAEFYGRRPIYLCSFAGFIIWIIPSAVAKNIETMIIARFFQGLAGSAFLSVSGGTVGDLFTRDTMLAPMAIFALAPFIGPSTGPLVGGLINTYTNWRWTHYVLLIWAGVLLVTIALFVPETYHPVLLKEKAKKIRKETGDDRWRAPIEKTTKSIPKTVGYSLLRPFQILIFEPMAVVLNVYTAILLGLLYLFFGAFPLIFRTNHGFNLWQVGLTFMGLLVAMIIACLSTPFWTKLRHNMVQKRFRETGVLKDEPEDQLPPVIFGAPLITGGLFWFGFTTYPEVHWIVPIIGSGVFGLGERPGFQRSAAFPLFGIQMYEALGYQWATGLVAFVTLAMMPFPYIFFRYGKRIRAKSRYATAT